MEVEIRLGVCNISPAESTSPYIVWLLCARPTPGHLGERHAPMSRSARRPLQNLGREPGRSGRRCR